MTTQGPPNTTYIEIETPHYKFEMRMTRTEEKHETYYFIVGDKGKPCLEGNITLENKSLNSRYNIFNNTASLIKLNALKECSLEDIAEEYLNEYSFGKEMLDAVIFFISSYFPIIKTISLNDTSYIPCKNGKTLDLLTYSIALYKKTWYEEKANAYILPKEKHENYRRQVEEYASKDTKDKITLYDIYKTIKPDTFAANMISTNKEMYEKMYEESETLPEFFQRLSKTIKREEKCEFFKEWLEKFIYKKISVTNAWNIDIYPRVTIIKEIKIKNKTRKQRK
jgi:hypothetical protein